MDQTIKELTKEEFLVLWHLEEGANFPEEIETFTNLKIEQIEKILTKLQEIGLVTIEKKYDTHYKKENWFVKLNGEEAQKYYLQYKSWIPKFN